jgi:hypothetical protein
MFEGLGAFCVGEISCIGDSSIHLSVYNSIVWLLSRFVAEVLVVIFLQSIDLMSLMA